MSQELLSLGKESVVYRKGQNVYKCYFPKTHPDFSGLYKKAFGPEDGFYQFYDQAQRRHLFYTEVAVLKTLSQLRSRVVPHFYNADSRNLTIKMEYVSHPTFQKAIVEQKLDPLASTEKMVRLLAGFHLYCDHHHEKLTQGTHLKIRSEEEEKGRLVNYIQAIIFHESQDLTQYWTEKSIDPSNLTPPDIRKQINFFLKPRGINIGEKIKDFIHRDRILNGNQSHFIWAEAKSQNIFYLPGYGGKEPTYGRMLFIDFPRARIGCDRDTDLFNIIHNIHRPKFTPQSELESTELANLYFKTLGIPSSEIPTRYETLLAARVKEMLRLHANYCQKNPIEIKRFLGRTNGEDPDQVKGNFLDEKLNSLDSFLKYYHYREGEGWHVLMEQFPHDSERVELVKQQIETIDNILRVSGVLTGAVQNKTRAKKFYNLLSSPF